MTGRATVSATGAGIAERGRSVLGLEGTDLDPRLERTEHTECRSFAMHVTAGWRLSPYFHLEMRSSGCDRPVEARAPHSGLRCTNPSLYNSRVGDNPYRRTGVGGSHENEYVRPVVALHCVLMAVLSVSVASGQDRMTGRMLATRSEIIAPHGMAATSQPLATQIALDILKQGGSAVDAAIAANAALGLMNRQGPGSAATVLPSSGTPRRTTSGINASGRSLPRSRWTSSSRLDSPEYRARTSSVTVPGCVDGGSSFTPVSATAHGGDPRAGDRYAREGSGERTHRLLLERSVSVLRTTGFRETFMRAAAPPKRRDVHEPGPRRHVRSPGEGRRTFLQRADRTDHRSFMRRKAASSGTRSRDHTSEWSSRFRRTTWIRRLGTAAERAGNHGPPDAQDSRRIRHRCDGFGSVGHIHALSKRRTRFRGPRGISCGSRLQRDSIDVLSRRSTPPRGASSSHPTGPRCVTTR